jgi:hypothetical protein
VLVAIFADTLRNIKMSKSEKRKYLFNKFSQQLKDIVQLGLYDIELPYDKTFICPICLKLFSENDLDIELANHLTLEDAPPYSLGGKANTLTCKKCNNEAGSKIDAHLFELLNEQEIKSFSPNTSAYVTVEHQGQKVQGFLEIDNDGKITVTHLKKNNHPEKLEKYVEITGKGAKPNLFFNVSKVEIKKVEVALLKTAYILAFEHYGYPLILSKAFEPVRQQILKPDEEIYPNGFWSKQDCYNEKSSGVHLIKSKGIGGFMSIFMLETKNKVKSGYGVYLPISIHTYKAAIENLKKYDIGSQVEFESFMTNDYFNDKENQKLCLNFMKKQNN